MRRKIKQIDVNELFDADDINRTSIKKEMRKLYVAINQKLIEGGWSARDMVKWLDERGVCMSVELFRVYLNDLDRERGYSRSKNKVHGTSKNRFSNETPRAGTLISTTPVLEKEKPEVLVQHQAQTTKEGAVKSNASKKEVGKPEGNNLNLDALRKTKKFEYKPN